MSLVHLGSGMFWSWRNQVSSALDRALRLWLVLSLWPTPLPWLHRHEGVDQPRLISHLHEYHAHRDVVRGSEWHLHFAYVWQLAHDPDSPDKHDHTPPNELPAVPVSPSPWLAMSGPFAMGPSFAFLDASLSSARDAGLPEVAARVVVPDAWLDVHLGAATRLAMLGVMRC